MSKSESTRRWRMVGVAAGGAACAALLSITLPVNANVKPHDPPVASRGAACSGCNQPYNYSNYDPYYEVQPLEREERPDTTWVALGAISAAGATLGITLGVRRRRDPLVISEK
ncbi:hypothetical protein OG558_35685 [Kribbella sp. NBC_01510]|uniref:hypothetical protein n=1 Tax=Kribbella sp. NBC_01510 TaxID=2903581 RepID=UPI00386C8AAC